MLRKFMGGLVALMLVATLLLPAISVGAQDGALDPGPAPVLTEETVPESESPPVEEEPPIVAPQPEAPVVDEPVVKAPVVEEPVVEEPAAEEPATGAESPPVEDTTGLPNEENPEETDGEAVEEAVEGDTVETAADESGEVEAAETTSISGVGLTCTGLVSFTVDATNGGPLTIWLYNIDDIENTQLGEEIIASPSPGATQVQFSIEGASLTDTIGASIVDDAYDLIGQTTVSGCADDDGEEETDEEQETGQSSTISSISVSCNGLVTFTITNAQPETLLVTVGDPEAPYPHNELASGTFEVTETGTFSIQHTIEPRDSVAVTLWSENNDSFPSARVNNCVTEEQETNGGISGLTVTCDGAVSLTVDDMLDGDYSIDLYGFTGSSWQWIGWHDLNNGILTAGSYAHTFDVPANTWDTLRAEVNELFPGRPFGVAEVSGCIDDGDPDPEPTETTVINLRLFCNGLVRFDLTTEGPVTLDIDLTTIAPTPEFARSAQVSGGSGAYQHQFGVPAAWYNDFAVTISLEGEPLAETSIYGCLEGELNTPPGDEVLAFTRYGLVIFDQVTAPGDTVIDRYWEPNPPALPEGFEASDAQYFALSTTSTHSGAIEVCLGLSQPFIENSDGVRLLQYAGGSWVDVTSSVQPELGQACGVTTSLSTFAIARQADDPDPDPDPDPTLPVVTNLTVDCSGLVTFDLETSESVVLDVAIFIPAAAPGYRDSTQISAESGPQQVQFELPVHPYEWATSVSLGTEWLADATVQGCPVQPLNTLPGSDVTVPVAGGTVTFENVLEPGETIVTQLDPASAPPLPAEYDGQLVIMVDLSTTAVIDGAAEVCLPIAGEVAEDAENVRLLHFENGAWVDITTSAGNGQVCGVTSSFSPFAIVHLADDDPGKPVHPGQPGGPDKPGHHPQPTGGGSGSSASLTSLPNTGGGAQPSTSGTETVQLILGALALAAAAGLRISSTRTRGRYSR